MSAKWNLTANQWSDVLLKDAPARAVADDLTQGKLLPWTRTLLQLASDSKTILDLGSGRGENAAALALDGKQVTLVDWSRQNLEFSSGLFDSLRLDGRFCQADITRPLPFKEGSFDTVFSCGVFEYFNNDTIVSILTEAFRISRKRVIVMVPNAWSGAYRLGKWYLERIDKWEWGGEVPSYTLKPMFRKAGCAGILEFSVAAKHSLSFLHMPAGSTVSYLISKYLRLEHHSRPAWLRQGYLLITAGEKQGKIN